MDENHFEHNHDYKQSEGLAMDVPTSALLSKLFIQQLEHNQIFHILKKHKTITYFRYVDDILILYNTNFTNINSTLSDFNSLHQKLQFTMENEHDNQLNYLDLTIKRTPKQLSFEIYRKPTAANISIHQN
jgi:hypothetical protein